MVKSREDVVAAFNDYVNMNADELQKWLDDPQSAKAGTGADRIRAYQAPSTSRKDPRLYSGSDE